MFLLVAKTRNPKKPRVPTYIAHVWLLKCIQFVLIWSWCHIIEVIQSSQMQLKWRLDLSYNANGTLDSIAVQFSPSLLPSPSDNSTGCRNFPHCFLIDAALCGIIQTETVFDLFQWIVDCLTNTSDLCKFMHPIKSSVLPNLFYSTEMLIHVEHSTYCSKYRIKLKYVKFNAILSHQRSWSCSLGTAHFVKLTSYT